MIVAEPAWALPSGWLVACDVVWDIYIVLFRKMEFEHKEGVYFLDVEKYFYTFMRWVSPFAFHAAVLYA
jgi:hypothetical protein